MTAPVYRIRIHGRGGQGIKTASRVLGSALFGEGFQVQDAPRYGAERRGAPIFAYVRASDQPVQERGIIRRPDLVVVADDTLVQVPAAGVRLGLDPHSVVLICSSERAETWKARIQVPGPTFVLSPIVRGDDPLDHGAERLLGVHCAGAAARLLGVISRQALVDALEDELGAGGGELERSREVALAAYEAMAAGEGSVVAGAAGDARDYARPEWITLGFEEAERSAPSIHAAGTTAAVPTGLWRTMRPVIDHDRCHRCNWMCALPCPDSALKVDDAGYPHVDLDHCKGCLICVAQCPFHVIDAVPEATAARGESDPSAEAEVEP